MVKQKEIDPILFKSIERYLWYVMFTKPDIDSLFSMNNMLIGEYSKGEALKKAKRILYYVKGTITYGLFLFKR